MEETVFEQGINTVGKIFLAAVTSTILGKPSNVKIKGTPEQVETIKRALVASRELHDEINRPEATVQSIMDRLEMKRQAADEFSQVVGLPWPI